VVVALGSNLSGGRTSSVAVLEEALERFPAWGLTVRRRSSWWRSAAWPNPAEPEYINGVAIVETSLGAGEVLGGLHALEASFGRLRERPNAPRVLDLDLVAFGRFVSYAPELAIPHPRAADRRFVMGPLAEVAPGWRHPVTGELARDLADRASVGRDAAPLAP